MAMDIRQATAAFLTLSMFVMLGNMVKRDHFDSIDMKLPATSNLQYGEVKVTKQSLVSLGSAKEVQWIEKETLQSLKPCWNKHALRNSKTHQSNGYITFSLTNGPESHAFQIANAVIVAKHLNATLVVPDIKGSKPEETRNFDEIYDTERFIRSLDGLINLARKHPDLGSNKNLIRFVKIPNRVSEDYITDHIEHLFKRSGSLRLEPYPVNVVNEEEIKELDKVSCLAMFGTLYLQSEVQNVIDSMVRRLRKESRKPNGNGEFVAVDLKIDMLQKKGCRRIIAGDGKNCYDAHEIGEFLNKIGYDRDTTVYLTQSTWDNSLDAFKELFPKTYTKEGLIPADKKKKFLSKENSELEKVIDQYICAQSDAFVPTVSGPFYTNVVAKRIATGKTNILIPQQITTSSTGAAARLSDYISPYVTKKTHFAYSCFC